MIPVEIDISNLVNKFQLSSNVAEDILQACVEEVAGEIYLNWVNQAKQSLFSTRTQYVNGLLRLDKGRFEKAIVLTGKLNNMIESGASPFDIKMGFMKSQKVRYTAAGKWYLTVPFRFGVPGTLGQAGFSNELPDEVYKVLKKDGQLNKKNIPSPFDLPRSRQAIKQGKIYYPAYQHKSSIFQGVVQQQAAYDKAVQNTYKSFRRAGENSDPNSWIHSGIKAYKLADKAVNNTDISTIVSNKALEMLDNIL